MPYVKKSFGHFFLFPATRIEFFVGDVPDGAPLVLDNARYTRLG